MVYIVHDEQSVIVNLEELQADALLIKKLMGYEDFDLSILLTNNQTIAQFNRDFRHKDEPTDILSFPFYPDIKAGDTIHAKNADEKNIGDLIISLEYIQPFCTQEQITINQHLKTLLSHGICHLLGYDHYTQETDKVMKAKEAWLAHCLKERSCV